MAPGSQPHTTLIISNQEGSFAIEKPINDIIYKGIARVIHVEGGEGSYEDVNSFLNFIILKNLLIILLAMNGQSILRNILDTRSLHPYNCRFENPRGLSVIFADKFFNVWNKNST